MAGEQSDAFPEELREWVERRAAEHDADPGAVLARAVSVYRYLDAEAEAKAEAGAGITPADVDPGRLDDMGDRLEALSDRVGGVEDDLDTKIDDVRDRVIQVKREADDKASRTHDHPELSDRVDAAATAAENATAQVDALADRLDRGFENYEEILEYLTDTTDDLERTVDSMADTVADLRSTLRHVGAAEADRRAVDDLRTVANRHGDRTAACGDCGSTVDVGLLSRPRCPHCEATYTHFEPSTGFFGSATLVTGDRPALTDGENGGRVTDEAGFGGPTGD
ncbi:hypothetical protein [Haloplanus sp.]|uniref:hypothetical protein n=1 Tax=Haloplanus sp. TaxID=1961696 RepID=UPI002615DC9D|nr:hypothetical protein [Haloplanus sp.]